MLAEAGLLGQLLRLWLHQPAPAAQPQQAAVGVQGGLAVAGGGQPPGPEALGQPLAQPEQRRGACGSGQRLGGLDEGGGVEATALGRGFPGREGDRKSVV